jgi:outer membrane protein assembly factor BamD (BamD/ComL family)
VIRLVVILLSALWLAGCAGVIARQDAEYENADRLMKQRKYSEASSSFAKIAKDSAGTERGARALFSEASSRAFFDNPHKDYALALQEFDEFLKKYPKSPIARDAQNWRSILKLVLELKKENEQLTNNIDELKRLDIRHEERRRK